MGRRVLQGLAASGQHQRAEGAHAGRAHTVLLMASRKARSIVENKMVEGEKKIIFYLRHLQRGGASSAQLARTKTGSSRHSRVTQSAAVDLTS